MAEKRLYRVTATYGDGRLIRHYLTSRTAEKRAAWLREGRDEGTLGDDDPGRPPAMTVTVEASDPITWSDDA